MNKWITLVTKTLGDEYSMLKQKTLGPTNIILYAHNSIIDNITDVHTASVTTGLGNMVKNKGAVGVSM